MAGKDIIVNDGAVVGQESEILPEITVREEKYYLESDKVIQYELNMLDLPFFSKNSKIRENESIKYIFSESMESYMQVVPFNHSKAGFKIPQEFDEKIFLAIMRLAKTEGKSFISTYYQLLKLANIKIMGRAFHRVKESLYRLYRTTYIMKNCFYSPLLNEVVKSEVPYQILKNVKFLELDQMNNLTPEIIEKYKNYFNRGKAETLIYIELSDEIYSNIENKGYRLFDAEKLLAIETSGERKLYQMLEKWCKGNERTITRKCKFLAAKIPLSAKTENIGNTVRLLKKYAESLKDNGYIEKYEFHKAVPVFESAMTFYMKHQNNMEIVLNNANKNLPEKPEEINIIDVEDGRQMNLFENPNDDIMQLKNMLSREDKLKVNFELIEKYYASHGRDYVKSNIEYTKSNAKDFSAMFHSALEKDYAEKLRKIEEGVQKRINEALKPKEEKETVPKEELVKQFDNYLNKKEVL